MRVVGREWASPSGQRIARSTKTDALTTPSINVIVDGRIVTPGTGKEAHPVAGTEKDDNLVETVKQINTTTNL